MTADEMETIASMIMSSIALNLGDKTFLRGITDFAEAYADPQRYMSRWASGFAASMLPASSLVAQGARSTDDYMRESRTLLDTIRNRVPGTRQQLAVRHDVAGEAIRQPTWGAFSVVEAKSDPLADTMLHLGLFSRAPGRKLTIRGRSYELTSDEYQDYASFVQQQRWARLSPLVQTPGFQSLMRANPAQASYQLDRQWDKIGEAARQNWLMRNPSVLMKIRSSPLRYREPSVYTQ